MREYALMLTERLEGASQLESEVDPLAKRVRGLGQMVEHDQRLLKVRRRFAVCATGGSLSARLPQEIHRSVPQFRPHGMVRQAFDMLAQTVGIKQQNRLNGALV